MQRDLCHHGFGRAHYWDDPTWRIVIKYCGIEEYQKYRNSPILQLRLSDYEKRRLKSPNPKSPFRLLREYLPESYGRGFGQEDTRG
jgi:hypothetical protein